MEPIDGIDRSYWLLLLPEESIGLSDRLPTVVTNRWMELNFEKLHNGGVNPAAGVEWQQLQSIPDLVIDALNPVRTVDSGWNCCLSCVSMQPLSTGAVVLPVDGSSLSILL